MTPRSSRRSRFRVRALLALAALSVVPSLFSQYTPSLPARPFPGYANERLRGSDPYMSVWDIGVNVRGRYEVKDGAGFTDAGQNWDFSSNPAFDNNNSYGLLRVMPRVAYTGKWLAATVEG